MAKPSKGSTPTVAKWFAPLRPLPGEFSAGEVLAMHFDESGLPFLGRDDVIFNGTSTLIAAREKGGKSTLVRRLAHSWVLEGHRVLYLSEEFERVWRKQLEALGIEGDGHFQIVPALGRSPEELLGRARGPEDIVIVDTATWLLGISLGNRDQVVEALRPWISLCRTGKSVVILGHLTKRDEIAGSHVFAAGLDTVITYREGGDDTDIRIVETRSRMHADTQRPFAVRKTGSTFSIEDVPNEYTLSRAQAEALEVLPTEPTQAMTWEDVAARCAWKEGKTRRILHELIDLKLARDITGSLGSGGRGNAARYVAVEADPES
jgi:hypothetical protein